MSRSRRRKQTTADPSKSTARHSPASRLPRWTPVAVAFVVIFAGSYWLNREQHRTSRPAATATKNQDTKSNGTKPVPSPLAKTATAAEVQAFEKLKGRWERPDGGYVIEIRDAAPDGKLEASYFNPQPIHVAKAEATQQDAVIKVFLELRAENYPGSIYNLTYDPDADQLAGIYFQAALQQQFEVVFERMKP